MAPRKTGPSQVVEGFCWEQGSCIQAAKKLYDIFLGRKL